MFDECVSLESIYVPGTIVYQYKNNEEWIEYWDIIFAIPGTELENQIVSNSVLCEWNGNINGLEEFDNRFYKLSTFTAIDGSEPYVVIKLKNSHEFNRYATFVANQDDHYFECRIEDGCIVYVVEGIESVIVVTNENNCYGIPSTGIYLLREGPNYVSYFNVSNTPIDDYVYIREWYPHESEIFDDYYYRIDSNLPEVTGFEYFDIICNGEQGRVVSSLLYNDIEVRKLDGAVGY